MIFEEYIGFVIHNLPLVVRFECLSNKCWFNELGYGILDCDVIKDLRFKDDILELGGHGVGGE